MAETTTKAAAVWKPPRIMRLALGGTRSGTKGQVPYSADTWELTPPHPTSCSTAGQYRMPISAEPSSGRPNC